MQDKTGAQIEVGTILRSITHPQLKVKCNKIEDGKCYIAQERNGEQPFILTQEQLNNSSWAVHNPPLKPCGFIKRD